jgi:ribosomal protein L7/L12
MRLRVESTQGIPVTIDVQANGHPECKTAIAFMEGFLKEHKEPDKNPHGNTVITMDNLAEALAILNQRKSCKIEFIKFIRRITGMGVSEAKEWVEAHFDRWHTGKR